MLKILMVRAFIIYGCLSLSPAITTLGIRASQLLSQSCSASIWGNTSQGLFLHLPPGAIIFLSYDNHHGPLTANLAGDLTSLQRVNSSEEVRIDGERLTFSGMGITLGWRDAAVWDIPPLPQVPLHIGEAQERYQQVYRLVTARRPTSTNLSLRAKQPVLSETKESNLVPDDLLQNLLPLLGQGEGLTPAGDDVILGCLLALSRWGSHYPYLWISPLSEPVVIPAAYPTHYPAQRQPDRMCCCKASR